MESGTGTLNDLPLSEVLDRLAEKTPAPGAGSTAALVCSLAAALLEMTAAFDTTPMGSACGVRAEALRGRALELADRELHSYEPVLAALRLPGSDPDREARVASAMAAASTAPLAIASVAAQLAGIAAETVDGVSDQLVGEAVVASELAEGACRAAARLVQINLAGAAGDPRLTEVAGLVKAAAEARAETLAKASDS
jgi:formiminotetrahydrofolate cyclodeaminase